MIRPPIVIDAQGDLLVFSSVATAELELAPADVRAGQYPVAYDSEGRLLRIEVRTQERRILGLFPEVREHVRVLPFEHIPTHDVALRQLLLRFISPRDGDGAADGSPVDGLLRSPVRTQAG